MIDIAKWFLWTMLFMSIWFENKAIAGNDNNNDRNDEDLSSPHQDDKSYSRQKRMLWITTDGRLALPPGTSLTIDTSLSLPFVRFPPEGFKSGMSISLPFTIDFDALGLTDNENPFGAFPHILGKSMGRRMGSVLSDYVAQIMGGRRSRRSIPKLPKPLHLYFQGGERAVLYTVVEDLLANFGMDGKACLLRAICEVNGHKSIHKFGFIGELLQLFFKVSKSTYANCMKDYVNAEIVGKNSKECFPYFKDCPTSLFLVKNRYTEHDLSDDKTADDDMQMSAEEIETINNFLDDQKKSGDTANVTVTSVPLAM